MNTFNIDQRILDESINIASGKLSEIQIVRDQDLPWFILIPRVLGAVEIIDLSGEQQLALLDEINTISHFLKNEFKVDKVNIGAIGNMVRQLHIHIVGRFENDRIFPKPPWGSRLEIGEKDQKFSSRIEQCRKLQQLLY